MHSVFLCLPSKRKTRVREVCHASSGRDKVFWSVQWTHVTSFPRYQMDKVLVCSLLVVTHRSAPPCGLQRSELEICTHLLRFRDTPESMPGCKMIVWEVGLLALYLNRRWLWYSEIWVVLKKDNGAQLTNILIADKTWVGVLEVEKRGTLTH